MLRPITVPTLLVLCALVIGRPGSAAAQQTPSAHRAIGMRIGNWDVDVAQRELPDRSAHLDLFIQRGLADNLVLENSLSFWRVQTTELQAQPGRAVHIKSYVLPLFTSLKLYPAEETSRLMPYISLGGGIAFGIEDEAENAVGGGGTSVLTGIGARGSVGTEVRLLRQFGLTASARYQWLHFGEDVGSTATYAGLGFDGGVTYRFQF